jgi:Phytanoyl-CoA dioxygenase (PhyH)
MHSKLCLPAFGPDGSTPSEAAIDSAVEKFRASGYLEIPEVFDPSFVLDMQRSFLADQGGRTHEEMAQDARLKEVGPNRFMSCLEMKPPFSTPALYANPFLLRFMARLLGPEFKLDSFNCVCAYPGAPDQRRHRDHPALFSRATADSDCFAVQVSIPLIDLSPAVGTTAMLPGSHLLPLDVDLAGHDIELPFPRMGSCCVMDYRLSHHGTGNPSDLHRPILYLLYTQTWFTDMINFSRQPAIRIRPQTLAEVPTEHLPLFERMTQSLCDSTWWL